MKRAFRGSGGNRGTTPATSIHRGVRKNVGGAYDGPRWKRADIPKPRICREEREKLPACENTPDHLFLVELI